ncbi:hypothetical protein CYR55_02430 [Chimaeribacter californicus]|uniref:HTH lacI-type domain-containing protein n=1 Tax=Chimaeribacter californicus TaxID=2060067 RepID=A0A2N5EGN1_9GAMM|nr:LacI family DNA-binding transcriptional regulator [Chimaeribacter californicus]PLR41702.1 hypothetical protein CYR55_02430 [Chimaeribacter californicus]
MGKLKIKEISLRTGLSFSTVSRVLAGKSNTSQQARDKILACAREIGVAETLSNRLLINNILLFAPDRAFYARQDHFYYEVIQGVQEAIAPHDVHLHSCALQERHADIPLFLEKLNTPRAQAIILLGIDDPVVHKLAASFGKPCVLINSLDQEMALDSVSPDHRAIGFRGAHYLLEQGHHRILSLLCLRPETLVAQLEGIKSAFHHHRCVFDEEHHLLVTQNFCEKEAQEAVRGYFTACAPSQRPSVLLCGGSPLVNGAIAALKEMGLRVPQDVSLLGSGVEHPPLTALAPWLTTLHVPSRALGVEAVNLLQNRLTHPDAPVFNLRLQGKLGRHYSVAQPGAGEAESRYS